MKIALVHDFLREYGGAERVVEGMHEIWPEAPLYTSFVDWNALGVHAARFKDWDVRTSWVQHNWLVKKYHSPLRFLAPKIWRSFDLSGYDVVISSSGWFMCRGVIVKKPAPHICYIHHPPRSLYGYATGSDLQKYWPVRLYATIINFFLRHYDFETAQRVDYFVANSFETARRVEKFYRRDSTVIYPPVDILTVKSKQKGTYFLSVGRLTYAKRVDLAIAACNNLKLPLKIVGQGKEEVSLRSIAGPTIEFVGSVSDSELAHLYAGARAFIFCALDEDFGMVPVEAMGYGLPVVALAQGGVLETVVDGSTGILFNNPTVSSLEGAIKKFLKLKKDWSAACVEQAQKFSKERFKKELKFFVNAHVGYNSSTEH
jgi:glycosyltransferase involved in cell wall biosynthesis